MLFNLGAKYRIQGGFQCCKNVYHECKICHDFSARPSTQLIGNLPAVRVRGEFAFKNIRLDACTPFMTRNRLGTFEKKNVTPLDEKEINVWVVMFICMATKVVRKRNHR